MRLLEEKKLINGKVCGLFQRKINNSLPKHMLDCYKIIFFNNASGIMKINEGTYKVQNSAVFIIPPMTSHQFLASEDIEYIDMIISNEYINGESYSLLCKLASFEPTLEDQFGLVLYPNRELAADIRRSLERLLRAQLHTSADFPTFFGLEFGTLLLNLKNSAKTPDSGDSCRVAMPVIKDYINKHFADGITLEEVAEKYSYSPSYLSRMFKQREGIGFKEYVLKIKLEYACRLLRDSRWTTTEIALMAGFSNKTFFYKAFRNAMNMTPNQFRSSQAPKY